MRAWTGPIELREACGRQAQGEGKRAMVAWWKGRLRWNLDYADPYTDLLLEKNIIYWLKNNSSEQGFVPVPPVGAVGSGTTTHSRSQSVRATIPLRRPLPIIHDRAIHCIASSDRPAVQDFESWGSSRRMGRRASHSHLVVRVRTGPAGASAMHAPPTHPSYRTVWRCGGWGLPLLVSARDPRRRCRQHPMQKPVVVGSAS